MITEKMIMENIGNYIQLGGHGIVDGLKTQPTKYNSYKIMGMDGSNMKLKQYRAKYYCILPSFNFNQSYRILTPMEFKELPIF